VPPENARALARAVIDLLHDPARCAWMRACGQRKAALYDWSIIAKRVLSYYEELIAAQPDLKTRSSAGKRRIIRVRHLFNWRRLSRRRKVAA
jgi:hypothetical protein